MSYFSIGFSIATGIIFGMLFALGVCFVVLQIVEAIGEWIRERDEDAPGGRNSPE